MHRQRIVVVGGALAGLRAAEQIRREGFDGDVVVVGQERHLPYNRPPLSKDFLAQHSEDSNPANLLEPLSFRLRSSIADVHWRLGCAAVGADLDRRQVELDDGLTLDFDGLVVATGLRPRRLDIPGPAGGRHVLRTVDDAVALRRELRPGARVVVVGAGFIGCEVAATARRLGCEVDVVEPADVPMLRPLGRQLGHAVRRHHELQGIRFHLGRRPVTTTPHHHHPGICGAVGGVRLDDGADLAADLLIESVGSHPNVEWLSGNGLDLDDGVLTDNALRVGGRAEVVAVGDVARFPNPLVDDVARRVEHWSIPAETAKRAARTVVAAVAGQPHDDREFAPLPSFWSDQFDLRIQGFGMPGLGDRVEILEGDVERVTAGEPLAVGHLRGDALVGVVLIGVPPNRHGAYRSAVLRQGALA